MHRDTSINTSLPDCQGVYMNIATVFNNTASGMKVELEKARSIGGTITMADIEEMLIILENQINNSLSQVTNQRVVIEFGNNYENVSDKVQSNIPQTTTESKQRTSGNELVRLTESDLHRIVKETVERIISHRFTKIKYKSNHNSGCPFLMRSSYAYTKHNTQHS